ncbi:uncharacterized protein FIBRA_00852 [Fibroporia radiculosa]|uniref:Dienelactone hydrolase domain-containing protein n=1 Tax=Fibroporia radiculosa TaxID=599839 RepID=J4I860_9APHY|nr:uncharacterized protein FIBRA_00852 [Fibroporia radiculosa]CCL98846.1 predicted protein [Fibroporia radiculosa]
MACVDCVSGNVHSGSSIGQEITLAGLPTYATGDPDSKRIIVIGVDIFGWNFINTRLLADEYAARGFRVYIPDLFDGRELPQWTLSAVAADTPTLLQRMLRPLSLFAFVPFILRNSKTAQSAKIGTLLKQLRQTQADAKIGFIGFCWGGRYAITMNSDFDATVACHPSLVKYPTELDNISKPISFALAAEDPAGFGAVRGKEAEKLLKDRGLTDLEVIIYDGVHHGWTVRVNMADEKKKQARDKAKEQALAWFEKYLTIASQ